MKFGVDEREYLNEMRILTTDNAGNEIFVGLTVEESREYYELTRLDRRVKGDSEARDRQLVLNEKHETERVAKLGAEAAARQDTSPGSDKHLKDGS